MKIKTTLKLGITFVITIASLWLLLVLSASIPNEKIRENMKKSAWSYNDVNAFSFADPKKLNTTLDNYADSILLNVSWHMGNGNKFVSTLNTRYNDGGEFGENYGLFASVTKNSEPNKDYTRYFHGWAMFVRLFHLFTDVDGMKLITFVILCIMALFNFMLLIRKKHPDIAIAFLLSLLAVNFYNVRLSVEYQIAFVLFLAFCPIYLRAEKKSDDMLVMISVIGGTAMAFFDFLTTETILILFPMIMIVAIRAKEGRFVSFKHSLALVLKCGIAYFAAYAMTFVVKWSAASLVTQTNAFSAALSSVAERVGGAVTEVTETPDSIFSAAAANLCMLFGTARRLEIPKMLTGIFLALVALMAVWYLFRAKTFKKDAVIIMLLTGSVVFLRYIVLNNHSFLHCFFTHRALISPIFALILSAFLNMRVKK